MKTNHICARGPAPVLTLAKLKQTLADLDALSNQADRCPDFIIEDQFGGFLQIWLTQPLLEDLQAPVPAQKHHWPFRRHSIVVSDKTASRLVRETHFTATQIPWGTDLVITSDEERSSFLLQLLAD
jgi:hypothetical protein